MSRRVNEWHRLNEEVMRFAVHLHHSYNRGLLTKADLFGDKRKSPYGGGPTAKGLVGSMIQHYQKQMGYFNEDCFKDVVLKGSRSKHYFPYGEDQA